MTGGRGIKMLQNSRKQYNTPGSFSFEQWSLLVEFYSPNFICIRCKNQAFITPDHIVPVSKLGSNWIENIQPLCERCNSSKNDKITDCRFDCGEFNNKLKILCYD